VIDKSDGPTIRQIMPATGWSAVSVGRRADGFGPIVSPIVCFALLEPPYPEPEERLPEIVVPMIMDGDEVVLADHHYWQNEVNNEQWFVGYLGPGEDITQLWVQQEIARIMSH
jgi:hypothetical protein